MAQDEGQMSTSEDPQIIRAKEVMSMTGLSKSALYSIAKDDETFPKRVQLGSRAIGWVKQEVVTWLNNKIDNR
ncbi:helix-turn-helix transcriptional regulator [Vibrio sp. TBV020]|uniref:helix-turn-helix transcriptional regulator n=1 Tax=Vibrio sp. TBV020 TaxID=3137398 RepID=UPI0038CD228D